MKNYIASMETNLGRAFLTMVLAFLVALASMLVLDNLGYNPDLSFVAIFAAMPFFAWFISRAAKTLGKNPLLYGVVALFPPFAILCFMWLQQEDVRRRIEGP